MNSTLYDEDGSRTQQLSPGFHTPRGKTPWSFRPDSSITQSNPEKNLKLSPHLQLRALPIVPSWHHRITFFFWCCQQWKICQSTQIEGSARKHSLTDPSLEHGFSCAWLEARVEGHQRGLVPRPSYSATPILVGSIQIPRPSRHRVRLLNGKELSHLHQIWNPRQPACDRWW